MDPITHGILGSAIAIALMPQTKIRHASLIGFLAGMAPDLDFFVQSKTDPLLALEVHRSFTHSFVFIPFAALILSFIFQKLFKFKEDFKLLFWVIASAYASHCLLDSCTSYGTQLLWPFNHLRVSWDNISIVDPILSLIFLFFLILALITRRKTYALVGLLYCLFYLTVGFFQREQIKAIAQNLAISRLHAVERLEVKPTFGNIILWKSIYESGGNYYVDAVRKIPFGKAQVYSGVMIPKLDFTKSFPNIPIHSVQARDVERFRWFSQDFLALNPQNKNQIIDVRYSLIPNQIDSLWAIELNAQSFDEHVKWRINRSLDAQRKKIFWEMILLKP